MSIAIILGASTIIAGITETAQTMLYKAKVRARRDHSKRRWA